MKPAPLWPRPQIRDDLALVEGYHSPQVDVRVRLNTNEAPEGPPAEFQRRWADELRSLALHRYPDRSARRLRESIAALHGVSPEQVLVGNGSNEVLQAVCLAYGGPGRTALTFEPTYAMHSHLARVAGTRVIEVERSEDFGLTPGAAASSVDELRPDLVFLCSPNNPTGRVEDRATVEAVVAGPALVVVDEAYGQFAPWSAVELLDEDRALVVTRTFSKTWAMAGLRLGYLLGPSWLVHDLEQVILPYHLDAAKQLAGCLALEYVDEMEARVATIVAQRERLISGLGRLDVDVFPSGANFVLFRPRSADGSRVWSALVDRSVLVRDCSSWPRLERCLRVTVGTADDNDEFLRALSEVMEVVQ